MRKIPYLDTPKYITRVEDDTVVLPEVNYVATREEVFALMNSVCYTIRHPITILNVNYELECNGAERIDFTTSFYAMRQSCSNLRIAADKKDYYCSVCDLFHARCCRDLIQKGSFNSELPTFFPTNYTVNCQQLESKNGISYLIYDCPMLGYCEMCFPIYFRKEILGILFVGQICLQDREKKRENIAREFIEYNSSRQNEDGIFQKYISKFEQDKESLFPLNVLLNDIKPLAALLDTYSDSQELRVRDYKHALTQQDLECLIDICCKEVTNISEQLEEIWRQKRIIYFKNDAARSVIGKCNHRFHHFFVLRWQLPLKIHHIAPLIPHLFQL